MVLTESTTQLRRGRQAGCLRHCGPGSTLHSSGLIALPIRLHYGEDLVSTPILNSGNTNPQKIHMLLITEDARVNWTWEEQ